MRWDDVEGGVDRFDLGQAVRNAPVAQHLLRIPHLDDDVVFRVLVAVGDTGDVIGDAEVFGQNRDLEGADLVGDVAVTGDGVSRGGEQVDALVLHGIGNHVVGQHRGLKAHLRKAAGGEPGALQIRPGLGAVDAKVLSLFPGGADDRADDGLAEALGQDTAPLRDQAGEIVSHNLHGAVAAVQRFDRRGHNGVDGILPRFQRGLRQIRRPVGDLTVAIGGRGTGVGKIKGGLPEEGDLLFLPLSAHLPGGQSHAHADGGVGAGTLGHHVGDGLRHLLIALAFDEADLRRVDPPVQNPNPALFIPGDVFIPEQEGHVLIAAFHDLPLLSQLRIRRNSAVISRPAESCRRCLMRAMPSLISARSMGIFRSGSVTESSSMTLESPTVRRMISVPA